MCQLLTNSGSSPTLPQQLLYDVSTWRQLLLNDLDEQTVADMNASLLDLSRFDPDSAAATGSAAAGSVAVASAAPQPLQKREPVGLARSQLPHRSSSRSPQLLQNRASSGFGWEQAGHSIDRDGTRLPRARPLPQSVPR